MPANPDHDALLPEDGADDDYADVRSGRRPTMRSAAPPASEPTAPTAPVPFARRPLTLLDSERYTEQVVIGYGGSSVVVRAFDNDFLRCVAVKILKPEIGNEGSRVDRFAEEARITGQLEHPNIVPVYELGRDRAGRRFLSMKLVQGQNLQETLLRLVDSRLEPAHLAELVQVFQKVCDAVAFAHSRGVIHRDLKPTNVMISDFGQVYVLDWGIARVLPDDACHEGPRVRVRPGPAHHSELDPAGTPVGTPGYMPPEQLKGRHHQQDTQTDIFALGATLYEILTGQAPLTPAIVRALWSEKSPPPIPAPEKLVPAGRVPPELSRIAMRALSFDPVNRYLSVADLKRDIESFQRGTWDAPRANVPAGAAIVTEGEIGDAAYVILEGYCVAHRRDGESDVQLRVMGPGDVFGETAVFSGKPRSASVNAQTDAVLLRVTGDVLSKAVGLNSWMGSFVRALADRFREADQRLYERERAGGV
jgi:eukaryotic-like serine/threonine-protein kinase